MGPYNTVRWNPKGKCILVYIKWFLLHFLTAVSLSSLFSLILKKVSYSICILKNTIQLYVWQALVTYLVTWYILPNDYLLVFGDVNNLTYMLKNHYGLRLVNSETLLMGIFMVDM